MKTMFKKALKQAKAWLSSAAKPLIMLLAGLFGYAANAFAAADPFASATGEIKGYQSSVQSLLYAIAAIIALVGAFNVFHKLINGDQDVKKTIMMTLGGCIALIALSTALPAFFE